ncbi:Thiamine-monophosphate kinase [subsurface metagenome]
MAAFAEKRGLNPLELAFQGGEEFELLFVVSLKHKIYVEKKAKDLGLDIYYLGSFTEEQKGVVILDPLFSDYVLPEKGFEHFTESD